MLIKKQILKEQLLVSHRFNRGFCVGRPKGPKRGCRSKPPPGLGLRQSSGALLVTTHERRLPPYHQNTPNRSCRSPSPRGTTVREAQSSYWATNSWWAWEAI